MLLLLLKQEGNCIFLNLYRSFRLMYIQINLLSKGSSKYVETRTIRQLFIFLTSLQLTAHGDSMPPWIIFEKNYSLTRIFISL
jgi:hypothetical protein